MQSHFSILLFLTRIRPCNLNVNERSLSSSRDQGYRSFISLWPVKNVVDLAVGSSGQEICCDSSVSSLSPTLCSWLALSLSIENSTGQILTNDPYMSAEGLWVLRWDAKVPGDNNLRFVAFSCFFQCPGSQRIFVSFGTIRFVPFCFHITGNKNEKAPD
jgi:hypothetical protein